MMLDLSLKNFLLSLLLFLLTWECRGETRLCQADRECADASFGSNFTELTCDGFQSCQNLTATSVSAQALCAGSQSCSLISTPGLEVGTLRCQGYESCMQSMIRASGNTYCWGQKSCLQSDINFTADASNSDSNSNEIDCFGVLSCALSNLTTRLFTQPVTVKAEGMFSMYDSVLDASESALKLDVRGYYAGYNATVICGGSSDYACSVTCYNSACYGMKLMCLDDEFCRLSCNESAGVACPDIVTYSLDNFTWGLNDTNTDFTLDVLDVGDNGGVEVSVTKLLNLDNSENLCVNEPEIEAEGQQYFKMCNDFKQCYNQTIVDNNNRSICCQGTNSCELAKLTTSSLTYLNSQNTMKQVIRCDGVESCELTTVIANNSIDCGGYHSCSYANLDNADVTTCSGYLSCLSSSIADADALYCNGDKSCQMTSIAGVSNIYSFGYHALQQATIRSSQTGSNTNVYMCAHGSAYEAEFCCYEGDGCNVFCANEDACDSLTVSSEPECTGNDSVAIHYNVTVAAQVCQVYLELAKEGNETNEVSTTETGASSTQSEVFETTIYTNGNDSSGDAGSGDDGKGTQSPSKGKNSNKSAESGLTTAVIIIATLVVVAIVALGIFYCMRSRNAKNIVSEEQKYQLLDKSGDQQL